MEKLVRFLEKGGLRFEITPLERDVPTEGKTPSESGEAAFLLPKTMLRATGAVSACHPFTGRVRPIGRMAMS